MNNILRKFLGRHKTNSENDIKDQPKEKNYCDITFHNHQNPEKSFIYRSSDPQHVYYIGNSNGKNASFEKYSETEFIMQPKQRQKKLQKKKESSSEKSLTVSPRNSVALSKPTVFTWKNKDAYIYQVASKFHDDDKKPDLEFVIYIPIDTAVTWLMDQTTGVVKYGTEEKDIEKHTVAEWKNESARDSDSDDDEDPNLGRAKETKDEDPKLGRAKETKAKGPKKTKKKARRIVTTYDDDDDEDEVSLGRLRPQDEEKAPVKIMAQKKLKP